MLFSVQLRQATWTDHEQAADGPYLRAVLAGRLRPEIFADLVAQHYFAYAVLEEAAEEWRADPVVGVFALPELGRVPSLEADLAELLGPGWADRIMPNRATEAYVARLRDVVFSQPTAFLAHHYTRYLGDLSGGQIIGARLARHYGNATRFYVFDRIPDAAGFRQTYRRLLDEAPLTLVERREVIEETVLAYHLNTEVLVELGRDLASAA